MSICIIPGRLRLLTIPHSSLPFLTHAIIRNLFFPSRRDTIFSYTENSVEISIVADEQTVLNDFPKPELCPGLNISEDPFRAMQIDNEYGFENAGKRISELSAPLAKAGISIFYLSTYQTDFVFVKEKRVPLVIQTLLQSNFTFLDFDDFEDVASSADDLNGSSERYSTARMTSLTPASEPISIPPSDSNQPIEPRSVSPTSSVVSETSHSSSYRTKPDPELFAEVRRACEIEVRKERLRLVGLNRDYLDAWALKIIKILFYPDALGLGNSGTSPLLSATTPILSPSSPESSTQTPTPVSPFLSKRHRFISYTSTQEGVSLVADCTILSEFQEFMINMSSTPKDLKCIHVNLSSFGLDRYGIVYSMSDPLTSAEINLLYLSTFRTANVLVAEQDLERALQILDVTEIGALKRSGSGSGAGTGAIGI
ncbi:hypothetical protein BKA69DRAFT_1128946 [Paraphysoderma sedebokerense]|nr:hypothetical protein BKA69DRAFT_1128946 [Paraphysoderma sedebokerense]